MNNNEKELNSLSEIAEKVSKLPLSHLIQHIEDHAIWYSEYTTNESDFNDPEWVNCQTEAQILWEIASRLRQVDKLGKAMEEEIKHYENEQKNNTP